VCPIENFKSEELIDFVCSSCPTEVVSSRARLERDGAIKNALIGEMLEEQSPTTIRSTDVSILENTTAWGGAVWRDGRIVYEWSAGKHGRSSSYRSECEAKEDALSWLEENYVDSDRSILLTDSLSIVSKLQRRRIKHTWFPKLRHIKCKTEVICIPGHGGIRYE
jgi:hypothetical protein